MSTCHVPRVSGLFRPSSRFWLWRQIVGVETHEIPWQQCACQDTSQQVAVVGREIETEGPGFSFVLPRAQTDVFKEGPFDVLAVTPPDSRIHVGKDAPATWWPSPLWVRQ